MGRSIAEAVLATAVFLIAMYMIIAGKGIPPAIFGSYFLGGITALAAGISLGVALYQWDDYISIFEAEEHVTNPKGLAPKVASVVVSMAGVLAIIGALSILYSLVSLAI